MDEDETLEQYLSLCERMFERMTQNGALPWPDSTDSEDVVESENPQK